MNFIPENSRIWSSKSQDFRIGEMAEIAGFRDPRINYLILYPHTLDEVYLCMLMWLKFCAVRENGTVKFLTKGDNNQVDDRGLYAPGQLWLNRNDVVGRAKG